MRTKFINSIKAVFVFCLILFSVIACEKDFEDVGVSLIDNNLFNSNKMDFEVISYSLNVDSSRVDNLPLYNLGVFNDPNFGVLNASFVAQIGIESEINFGLNPVIDTVMLDIPYYATRQSEDNSDGSPNFSLDSIIGDQELEYTLKVKRLTTFLNSLNPLDLTQLKRYYSNETFTGSTELYSGLFKPNKNDTILFVNRSFFEGAESIDSIKREDLRPTIKLPLDKTEIERIFITEASESNLANFENFIEYFRGVLIEAEGNNGALMSLLTSDATFTIYFTNDELIDEEEVDLNGDGDTDDLQVIVKTKRTLTLPLGGVRANNYSRNYAGAVVEPFINAPDSINGEEKLFVQGSAGSIAEFKVLIDLAEIRAKNWLINGAILDFYVEDDVNNRNVPERLYIYNADENSVMPDVITEAQVSGIQGTLERDEDTNEPIRYRFSITDYMSQVLRSEDPINLSKLALKTYHSTDAPLSIIDTIVKDFSWVTKGVVLHGNKDNGGNDETRLKLTIYYTENNN